MSAQFAPSFSTLTSLHWDDVEKKQPILLNLGGCGDCHPRKGYEGFVSVDTRAPHEGWWISHDFTQPIPLQDNSVERIHIEEVLQFFALADAQKILVECYRLLKPGGRLRISSCDYNHPKDHQYLLQGSSPHDGQLIFLHYELMKEILDALPFQNYTFLHYWKDGVFHRQPIDYSFGYIRRTPENDPRNKKAGLRGHWRNFLFLLKRGFRLKPEERVCLRGRPYFITSLVVDCVK